MVEPERRIFTQQQHQGDAMEQLLKGAFELGADEAKIIDTPTISFGDWGRWKCQYGCLMHDFPMGKDHKAQVVTS